MRLSCNGCRVLRKGCTDDCTIRPCLQWIKTPEAQANATVFLAKFYGRAGLLNLLAASPTAELRPAVFRSLLYEACGRAVNPVYGAVGLLWSGTWNMCQAAVEVEAVLKGEPIVVHDHDDAQHAQPHHLLTMQQHQHPNYDIRHVVKQHAPPPAPAADDAPQDKEEEEEPMAAIQQTSSRHGVAKPGRTRFKRGASSSSSNNNSSKKKKKITTVSSSSNNENEQSIPTTTTSSSSQGHASSGSSHLTTVAPSSQDDDADAAADQQEQLGLHLTLGFFATATTAADVPPPVEAHTTPAAAALASDDDDPGLLLGFRFL